jgi:hypothetical protein
MQIRFSNVKAFPTVAISILLALGLLIFGIYVIIPPTWLGLSIKTAYPNIIIRTIFGTLMASPAIPILYCNIKYDLKTLVTYKLKRLRPFVFWMGVTYLYLCVLRIMIAGVFPPIWLLYLVLGIISLVIWLANKYH